MFVEIEIPDEILKLIDAEGYQPTKEFRVPVEGEYVLSAYHKSVIHVDHIMAKACPIPRLIVRPKAVFPSMLGPEVWGIAMNHDGDSYIYFYPPKREMASWKEDMDDLECMLVGTLARTVPAFVPPVIFDWKRPLLNPEYKGPTYEEFHGEPL